MVPQTYKDIYPRLCKPAKACIRHLAKDLAAQVKKGALDKAYAERMLLFFAHRFELRGPDHWNQSHA